MMTRKQAKLIKQYLLYYEHEYTSVHFGVK